MKKYISRMFIALIALIAVAFGASGNVLMAAGVAQSDSDGSASSNGSTSPDNSAVDPGIASVSQGQREAKEMYETDLEQAILVLDPMGTAGLTLVETDAQSRSIDSQEFEFYSVGPRLIRTTTSGAVTVSASGTADRISVPVTDAGFAAKDDTIRVVGIKGMTGTSTTDTKDIMLVVIDRDTSTGNLICYAKNGYQGGFVVSTTSTDATYIPTGTTLIRMAKSCSESKAQTSRAHSYPASEKGYVQNFMLQIEQTEFDRMTKKRVSWNFNDIVEWNMRDYKTTKEISYFFGVGGLDRHLANEGEDNYTMTGIWWMAGRSLEIGHIATDSSNNVLYEEGPNGETAYPLVATTASSTTTYTLGDETMDSTYAATLTVGAYYYYSSSTSATAAVAKVEIDGKDLVAFNKAAFIGNGGSQVKYLLAGCNVIEAFDNIKGKQFETKDIVTENNLTVQNFKTSFGTIKLVYDKIFDINGMANAALMLDKQYVRKVVFKSMGTTQHDFMKSGQRNSHGVVLQEVNAIYLQYADAHAQVWLANRTELYDYTIAGKYDAATTTNKATSGSRSVGNYPGGHSVADA